MRKISEEIEKEYRELLKTNGYTDPDLDTMSIAELKATLKMQKKLNSEKAKNIEPISEIKKVKIKGIDMSRENASLFANDIQKALFQNDQILDEEVAENERLRWNCGKFAIGPEKNGVMILRNKQGEVI